jgi:SanA protein
MSLFSLVFDWKKWVKRVLLACAIVFVCVYVVDFYVNTKTNAFVHTSIETTPAHKVALLLGTSKFLRGNRPNAYYDNRIDATVNLWKAGKFERLIISGDNSTIGYNEPEDMRKDLVNKGIPNEIIYLDYAGFSTYESVVRADVIFSQQKYLLISQEFHTRRAVYTARYLGNDVHGFCAEDVTHFGGFKTKLREKFARVKMLFDLWFNPDPTFKGKKIEIN